jgi:tetratricopeptide (TPR) repeat protein
MKVTSLILTFFMTVAYAFAADIPADTLWKNANNHYSAGNYRESAQLYEQILNEHGESALIYFNLGNAYFKQNMQGPARLNYERALRLDPTNADILYNLDFVKALQPDKIDEIKDMFITTWLNDVTNIFSESLWSIVFLMFAILFLLLLAFFIFSRSSKIRKLAFAGVCLCFVLSSASFYLGSRQRKQTLNRSEAIIYSPEITVKSTPNDSGSDLFIIHEGLKVQIIEKQGNYYRIMLGDRKSQGWIPRESAEII